MDEKLKRGENPPTDPGCTECRKLRADTLETYIATHLGQVVALDTKCLAQFWVLNWDRPGVEQAISDLQDDARITVHIDRTGPAPRMLLSLTPRGDQ